MTDKTTGVQPSEPAKQPAKRAAPKPEPEVVKEEPKLRAAGYVNRDDGEGWVLEEEP